MRAKKKQKQLAVMLRKQGKTYSEILEKVPVAKSTLSLWLRDVGLAKRQRRRLTEKMRKAGVRGGQRRHEQRIEETKEIFKQAKREVEKISERDLWLIGVMLYWAEGTKEKEHNTGVSIDFANSDARMIRIFLMWLEKIIGIKAGSSVFKDERICVHKGKMFMDPKTIWSFRKHKITRAVGQAIYNLSSFLNGYFLSRCHESRSF